MATESNTEFTDGSLREPDAELVALIGKGDEGALTRLFQRYSGLVFGVALRVLKDPAAAEDVMQEIFLQIWRNPPKFQGSSGSIGSWLAVISRNRAVDFLRRRRPTDSIDDIPLASPTDLAAEAERHILMAKVREAVAKLPVDQRQALELAFFDGCTHMEIAQRLNHPLGTVKTRIRSALQKLEEAFRA